MRCPACGALRRITSRQHRRVLAGEADARCRPCRYGVGERLPPDDFDRAYWLRLFSDEEIADFGRCVFGHGDPETVHAWRQRLL